MATDTLIEWTGDLEDDCTARIGNMLAHAECMSGGHDPSEPISEDNDPNDTPYWFAAVYLDGVNDSLFHTGDHGMMPHTGEAARWLCEMIMRAYLRGDYKTPPTY